MLRHHRSLIILVVLLAASMLGGCRVPDLFRGEGFPDSEATWGQQYRAAPATKAKTQPFFLDEKSQQIERSLGL